MMDLEINGEKVACVTEAKVQFVLTPTIERPMLPRTITAKINIPAEQFEEWFDALSPTLITEDGEVSAFDLDVGYGVIGTLYNPHTVPGGNMWIEIIEARFKPDPEAVAAGVFDWMLPIVPNKVRITINEETHEVDVTFSREDE